MQLKTKKYTHHILILIVCFLFSGCTSFLDFINYSSINAPRYASLNLSDNANNDKETIKVVSYNIKHSRKIKRAIALIRESEVLSDADIILLQEMTPSAVEKIAKALKYNYVFYPAVIHPILDADFGNAVLSKWPILDDHKIILPAIKTKSRERIAVGCNIDIKGKNVLVYSLHMGVFVTPTQRKTITSVITDQIPNSNKYCIIAGDFNSFTKKDRMHITQSLNTADFEHMTKNIEWTYKQWFFFNRKSTLDHIYAKGLIFIQAGKVEDKSISDHLPIWTELSFDNLGQESNTQATILERSPQN